MPPIRNLIPPQYRSRLLRAIDPNLHDRNHLIRRDPEHLVSIDTLDISLIVWGITVKHSQKNTLIMEEIRPADQVPLLVVRVVGRVVEHEVHLADARHRGDGEAPALVVAVFGGWGGVAAAAAVVVVGVGVVVEVVVMAEVEVGGGQEVDEIESDLVPEHGALVVVTPEGGGGSG